MQTRNFNHFTYSPTYIICLVFNTLKTFLNELYSTPTLVYPFPFALEYCEWIKWTFLCWLISTELRQRTLDSRTHRNQPQNTWNSPLLQLNTLWILPHLRTPPLYAFPRWRWTLRSAGVLYALTGCCFRLLALFLFPLTHATCHSCCCCCCWCWCCGCYSVCCSDRLPLQVPDTWA